jgi:spore coat protein CotH
VDLTIPMFDPDHVLQIEITIDETDWDALRTQARTLEMIAEYTCNDMPVPSPFTYFHADVTVDGDPVRNVGVRKKCFLGSCDEEKPALKVKFNEYVSGQTYSGMTRLTLNNARQDPSFVKQCLGYDLFRAAGVPASRCNFAHVWVNGEDRGVYVHVESIKSDFLGRHFTATTGNLYEGALSDFRPGFSGTFECKVDGCAHDRSDLEAVVTALEADDDHLLEALDPILDVDAFYTFWAMEVIIGHWDGYAGNTNNFYFYRDPGPDRFRFIPWGIDGILMHRDDDPDALVSVMASGLLARRLYMSPETQADYVARLRALLDDPWDRDALLAEIDAMEDRIRPHATDAELEHLTGHLDLVRSFVRNQKDAILEELDAGPPAWTGDLREALCMEEVGDISVNFATTWGSLGTVDPFVAGSGMITGTLDGVAIGSPLATGCHAGWSTEEDGSRGSPVVQFLAYMGEDSVLVPTIVIPDPGLVTPGVDIPISLGGVFGYMIAHDPTIPEGEEGRDTVLGMIMDGTLRFEAAGTTDDDEVRGTFSSRIIDMGF